MKPACTVNVLCVVNKQSAYLYRASILVIAFFKYCPPVCVKMYVSLVTIVWYDLSLQVDQTAF